MAPVATEVRPIDGAKLDKISDAVDEVNVYLGKHKDTPLPSEKEGEDWRTEKSKFDEEKDKEAFRNYADAAESVKAFYREQHAKQTVKFNLAAREKYLGKCHAKMTVWEAIEKLNTLVDESGECFPLYCRISLTTNLRRS